MNREVRLYDGTKTRIICDDSELVEEINRIMIQPFERELNMAWLTKNGAEDRAKNYMSRVASLMITEPGEHGVIDHNVERKICIHERPVADINALPSNMSRLGAQRIKPGTSRMTKIDRLKKQFPSAQTTWSRMDTEGFIEYRGQRYQFDDPQYAPVKKRGFGDYYQFDRVLVLDGSELQFFGQNIEPVFPKQASAAMAA